MDPVFLDIDGNHLTLAGVAVFLGRPGATRLRLTDAAREQVRAGRRVVEARLAAGDVAYGINTGFGRLADRRIAPDDLRALQRNLIRSHAAGFGPPLPPVEARLLLLLRANALAKGYSGVRLETLEALVAMFDAGVVPFVPEKGSVGASGDLAPLAHLALALAGEGEAFLGGERLPAAEALARAGLAPVALEAKEGLALINGTQMMTAIGAKAAVEARALLRHADVAAALVTDALLGTDVAFDPRIHALRPHAGQLAAARNLAALMSGSAIRESHRGPHCRKVQDAYSLRCAPQVHGAVRDALDYIERTLSVELNAATDNPLVFPDGEILSGGNFHGEPVALALDMLAIALAELGGISERRTERIVNPDLSGGLPPFLAAGEPGLESGFMMAQVTAAALASENKVLAHPASVDSIPTSGGTEDHVSMGVGSARKAREVLRNAEAIVAIELLVGAQGIEHHRPLRSSPALEAALAAIRARVPRLTEDRPLAPDIASVVGLIQDGALLAATETALERTLE